MTDTANSVTLRVTEFASYYCNRLSDVVTLQSQRYAARACLSTIVKQIIPEGYATDRDLQIITAGRYQE